MSFADINQFKEIKMGTFLKYVFYLALIVIIYLVGKGIYNGQINENTTVGSVIDQVDTGAQGLASEADGAVKNAVDNYQSAPKEDIKVQ